MKLETCRTVAHGKLEITEPTPLGLPGRVVANLCIFPLLGKKEGKLGTSHWAGARSSPWVGRVLLPLGLCVFSCFGWWGWGVGKGARPQRRA